MINTVKNWEELSLRIGGQFTFSETNRAHAGLIYKFRIIKEVSNGQIAIEQFVMEHGKDSFQNSLVTICYKTSGREKISLQIWRKTLLARIFDRGLKTGDDAFDRKFFIKSDFWDELSILVKNQDFKNFISANSDVFFTIKTVQNETMIIFKVNSFKAIFEAYLVLCELVKIVHSNSIFHQNLPTDRRNVLHN